LLDEATNSEDRESYRIIERNKNYRIGAGVELAPSGQPLFFIEVIVHLCEDLCNVDLTLLDRNLLFLKELRARGYSILSHDDSFVYCQKSVKPDDLIPEYEAIKLLAARRC
jgi:hypothetical protein